MSGSSGARKVAMVCNYVYVKLKLFGMKQINMRYRNNARGFTHSRLRMGKRLALFVLLLGLTATMPAMAQGGIVFDWVVAAGDRDTAFNNYSNDIVLDDLGNTYQAGYIWGNVQLGNITLTSGGAFYEDPFVSKMDANGNVVWAKSFECQDAGNATSIAVDNKGYVYITGIFRTSITIGSFNFASQGTDGFMVKLDTAGNIIWAKQIPIVTAGGGHLFPADIKVDTSSNIFITGSYGGGIAAFDTTYLDMANSNNAFIARADSSGAFVWAKAVLGLYVYRATGASLAIDQSDGVYAIGNIGDSARIENVTLYGSGGAAYIIKLNAKTGGLEWSRVLGKERTLIWGLYATVTANAGEIIVDNTGNIVLTGYFAGRADFNLGSAPQDTLYLEPYTNPAHDGSSGAYVLKMDTSGNFVWARSFAAISYSTRTAFNKLSSDIYGNVYAAGQFQAGLDFNYGLEDSLVFRTPDGHQNVYILKLDTEGNIRWIKILKSAKEEQSLTIASQGIAVNKEGKEIYTTGLFWGRPDFDPNDGSETAVQSSAQSEYRIDLFVHKLICTVDSNGAVIDTATNCNGYTINGQTFTTEGVHYATLNGWFGCDSIVTVNLSLILPDPVISTDVDTLSTGKYISYQWLKDGEAIPGATEQTYIVSENGRYSVVVTDESGCSDTSDVYPVTNKTDIGSIAADTHIRVFPNPAKDIIYVESPETVRFTLNSLDGKVLFSADKDGTSHSVSMKGLASGIYFLNISGRDGNRIRVEKIVKQ